MARTLHALIVCRGDRMGTPDGQQFVAFPLFEKALRERLGLTFTRADALDLDAVERAVMDHQADVAFLMVKWAERVEDVIAMLRRVRAARPGLKLVYLDYFAPTSSPHFGVAPYVDCYAKRQVLRDLGEYATAHQGGYRFAEYVAERFGFELNGWHFGSELDPAQAHKVVHAWNLGVTRRYWTLARLTRPFLWAWGARPIHINRRFGLPNKAQKVEWYQQYRTLAHEALAPLSRDFRCTGGGRVSTHRYFLELGASRIVFSPFGWGELCFRDYEAVACGALLVKPSMEHLKTSPDIFVPNETYVPVKWDLSDLEEKCRHYLAHPGEARRIAAQAHRVLRRYFERADFVEDVARILRCAGIWLPAGGRAGADVAGAGGAG